MRVSLLSLAFINVYVTRCYRSSSQELHRLEFISLSPVYTTFTEALHGATTIAAMRAGERFKKTIMVRFDTNTRCSCISIAANQWLTVRLEFLRNVLLVPHIATGGGDTEAAGLAGLVISAFAAAAM